MPKRVPARLYVLLAKESRQSLIYRRGPTKQVQLISWNRQDDRFTEGQWLKGRIYERRCDISNDGKYLLSFLQDYGREPCTWTVLSRPPYLTALALWPKGDAWGGGGLFDDKRTIRLNHRENEFQLGEPSSVKSHFTIESLHDNAGWGEDHPIWEMRLIRDGWKCGEQEAGCLYFYWKKSPADDLILNMKTVSIFSKPPLPWYHMHYEICDTTGAIIVDLDRTDWADWDINGDLLYAKDGCIYRNHRRDIKAGKELKATVKLIDLNNSVFEKIAPPKDYLQW